MPTPSDSGHGRPIIGLGVSCRTPGQNRCNIQITYGSPFRKLLRRGHFKKEETIEAASVILRPYKKLQRSNEIKVKVHCWDIVASFFLSRPSNPGAYWRLTPPR